MFTPPIWITNFKNDERAIGQNAVKLAKIHEQVARDTGISIAVAVSPVDIFRIAKEVSIPVISQHVDAIDFGKFTGHILPQAVWMAGATATLLNHSECRIDLQVMENTVAVAQKCNLKRIICAENVEEVERFSGLDPDFLAFEPPELIGSKVASVSSQKPDSIKESISVARKIPLLVGAGINSPNDVSVAMKFGVAGFLVSTAIVKSNNPEAALRRFVDAMKIA